MKTSRLTLAALFAIAPLACVNTESSPVEESSTREGAIESDGVNVGQAAFRADNGQYISAMDGGGSEVNVVGAAVKSWETFDIFDITSKSLTSGDQIYLGTTDGAHVLTAECGGGADLTDASCGGMNATRTKPLGWETFTLVKIGGSDGDAVNDGDQVALQAMNGAYCSAMWGGGLDVRCSSSWIKSWETFTISLPGATPPGGDNGGGDNGGVGNGGVDNGGGSTGDGNADGSIPTGDRPGWRLLYTDDFNGSSLGGEWNVANGFVYQEAEGGKNYVSADHVSVHDGLLDMKFSWENINGTWRPTTGWAMLKQGGAPIQTYGKYLVRFRADATPNVDIDALLWPQNEGWPPEVDFLEDDNGSRQMYAFAHYNDPGTYTWHESGIDGTQWHTMGVEWTPDSLKYTVDGKVWGEDTGAAVPHTDMWLGFNQVVFAGQADPPWTEGHFQIDWVAVYAPQ